MFDKKKIIKIRPKRRLRKKVEQENKISIPDVIAPPSVEVDFNHIRVGKNTIKHYLSAGIQDLLLPTGLSLLLSLIIP